MTQIVTKMRGELRDVLRDSVVDYTTKPRDKWLFDWPSQIFLVVNQVFWCQEVEQVGRTQCCLCRLSYARGPGAASSLIAPAL